MSIKRAGRIVLRRLLQDQEQFELWAGLTFFTASLICFVAGWTVLLGTWGMWVAVPAAFLASLGLLGLSAKVPLSGLILNRGLVTFEPKRGGQIAVLYGAFLFGFGVFGLSSLPYTWLEPSGSYGLAALLGASLILGGLYIVASTPILEPSQTIFEADQVATDAPVPWYVLENETPEEVRPAGAPLLPRTVEHRYAVPHVRAISAAKRPSMLTADDILAYAMIECDWVASPGDYTCITMEHASMTPLVESGDIIGINHAMVDAGWLRGKLCAAFLESGSLVIGFLQEQAGNGWVLQPRNEECPPIAIQTIGLVGAVEWSMKADSKYLRPAVPVLYGEAASRTAGYAGNHPEQ